MSTALLQQPTSVNNTLNTANNTNNGVPVSTGKSKIDPWDPKLLKKELKDNLELYKRVSEGLHVLPLDEKYSETTKALANELLTRTGNFLQKYKELFESTENKRVASIKPRLCDKKLTTFLSNHFKRYLPDNGQHGVLDLNRIAPRAISLYVKEKGLGETQFFALDDELKRLFESPSVENPSKTYIQLAQERIAEIRMERDYKQSPSSAEIFVENGRVTMNYSALKIIIPKFGVKYDLTDASVFVQQLEEFNKYLEQLHTQHEENKKAQKKANKK